MKAPKPSTRVSTQEGFTLIEVLVAATVLSVGLLGLASLQATALKLSDSAQLRSQATALAYEIADAIRANARNASNYTGTFATTCDTTLSRSESGNASNNDLAEWSNRIACTLPSGVGTLIHSSNKIKIEIDWSEARARGTDDTPEVDSPEDERDHFEILVQL